MKDYKLKKFLRGMPIPPKLEAVLKPIYESFTVGWYAVCCFFWKLSAEEEPPELTQKVINEATFICKSFERPEKAKRLYRSIQEYYPGAKVIFADDSAVPLALEGPEIIHLPFNSGVSAGLQAALERVKTKYTIRMDDDELLTPYTRFGVQLKLLEDHKELDLAAVNARAPRLISPEKLTLKYSEFSMKKAPKPLLVPHGTEIDGDHIVYGKVPNIFIVRTEKYQALGYDKNIRMIEHHEFFTRAAGVLVSCMDRRSFVYHYHNRFDSHYRKYRADTQGDSAYIKLKYAKSKT